MTSDSKTSAGPRPGKSGEQEFIASPAVSVTVPVLDHARFVEQEADVATESLWKHFLEPRSFISFLFAAVVLVFVVRQNDVSPRAVWHSIREANPAWYMGGLLVFYGSFVIRALRWRGMLDRAGVNAEHGFDVPRIPGILQILLISWFANCVAPAKLGDAVRGYLLKERSRTSFGLSMGTILAERLVDLIVLVVVLLGSGLIVFGTDIPRDAELAFLLGAGTLVIGVIGVITLWFMRDRVEMLLPERLTTHFVTLSTGIFESLRRPFPIIGYTVAIWLLDGVRLWMVARALGIDLHVTESQLVSLSSALVTIIPFTPGGLGVVESFMIWILGQVDVPETPATALAFLDRSISYFSLIVVGIPLYVIYLRHKVTRVVR